MIRMNTQNRVKFKPKCSRQKEFPMNEGEEYLLVPVAELSAMDRTMLSQRIVEAELAPVWSCRIIQ